MKTVAEIVVATILLASGVLFTPDLVEQLKVEAIQKIDQGLPSLKKFTNKLTN